ncbi:hypothetical protein Halru_2679 [Halovivax ruber XH-70]|uniref:DUF7981 domain-containing protein n=1 Tax=Halovivax ruber (strain DSM 18193 / JCM 13892 / XH-70) TaxID=797302 RepID=L0IEQ7_HALRX|nr:hypothetical protein [Halovivax ruber]AGB17254.1 hypothetical protein Halru_2679 [Halovivax ruber XH-70]
MDPRAKSASLWGLVGGLTFLVLAQGAVALDALAVPLGAVVTIGLAVAVVTAAVTYRYERRLLVWAREHGR